MGVELQHCVLYGYEMPIMDYEDYSDHRDHDPIDVTDEPQFFVLQEPRAHEWCYAGVLQYRSESTRWNGTPSIGPLTIEEPSTEKIIEMERIITGELPADPLHDQPEHYVFTHNW